MVAIINFIVIIKKLDNKIRLFNKKYEKDLLNQEEKSKKLSKKNIFYKINKNQI